MARSRRLTPIANLATMVSEKQDKHHANCNCRSVLRDVSDPWDMAKNGCCWFGHHFPDLMRK